METSIRVLRGFRQRACKARLRCRAYRYVQNPFVGNSAAPYAFMSRTLKEPRLKFVPGSGT
jgi:hypothetical protein